MLRVSVHPGAEHDYGGPDPRRLLRGRFTREQIVASRQRTVRSAAIFATLLALAVAPQAPAFELNRGGKTGRSAAEKATCKYGVFGPRGILNVGIVAPAVTGANTRARTRRERTYVRYRVDVTNAASNHETILSSRWSGWRFLRESQSASLPPMFFDMDWQGYYGADVLIEWWTSKRRIGFRWHRLEEFLYVDHYNRGPWGPFPNCNRYNFPFN